MRVARVELAAAARAPRAAGRARSRSRRSCPTSTTSSRTPGSGSATSTSATSPRSSARAGTRWSRCGSTVTWSCPPTRPPRSARPACWARCTSSSRRRPTSPPAGQAARRLADPAGVAAAPIRPPSRRWPRSALLLNGGGIGQVQDITEAFSTAFAGRENDLRSLIDQLDQFIGHLNDQTDDIIAATESLNNLVGQFAAQKPVVDKALQTIPDALAVLERPARQPGRRARRSSASSARWPPTRSTRPRKRWSHELKDLGPVLESAGQRRARR